MSKKAGEQGMATEEKNKKIVIFGAVLIVVILVAIIIFLFSRGREDEPKRNVVVTKDNIEEVADDMMNQDYIEPGYYSTSMSTTWHFATGDAISERSEEHTSELQSQR